MEFGGRRRRKDQRRRSWGPRWTSVKTVGLGHRVRFLRTAHNDSGGPSTGQVDRKQVSLSTVPLKENEKVEGEEERIGYLNLSSPSFSASIFLITRSFREN